MYKLLMVMVYMLLIFITPTVAMADWISGGGHIIKDGENPWFLQNTEAIRYCVQQDERYFQVGRERLSQLVDYSFRFWKRELSRSKDFTSKVEIGTQSHIEVSCSEPVDLHFQFGELTDAQRRHAPEDLGDYIGLAVRSEYDKVRMRGKGFIYIAPDKGPNRFHLPTVEGVWSSDNNIRLFLALLHEMQHVYGIRHGVSHPLLAANFLERLLLHFLVPVNESDEALANLNLSVFAPNFGSKFNICYEDKEPVHFNSFFGIESASNRCFQFKFLDSQRLPGVYRSSQDPLHFQWHLSIAEIDSEGGHIRNIGYIRNKWGSRIVGSPLAMQVYLPQGQAVFPEPPIYSRHMTSPVMLSKFYFQSEYVSSTGVGKPTQIRFGANKLTITGEWGSSGRRVLDNIVDIRTDPYFITIREQSVP